MIRRFLLWFFPMFALCLLANLPRDIGKGDSLFTSAGGPFVVRTWNLNIASPINWKHVCYDALLWAVLLLLVPYHLARSHQRWAESS